MHSSDGDAFVSYVSQARKEADPEWSALECVVCVGKNLIKKV